MQIFSAISEIINEIEGTSWSNYSDKDIPQRFCTSKTESLWHMLDCESSLSLKSTFIIIIMVLCSTHTII